jgi:hypothetical protein
MEKYGKSKSPKIGKFRIPTCNDNLESSGNQPTTSGQI